MVHMFPEVLPLHVSEGQNAETLTLVSLGQFSTATVPCSPYAWVEAAVRAASTTQNLTEIPSAFAPFSLRLAYI